MKIVNMKKDMMLEMGQCLKNVLIDGGRNAARLGYLGYPLTICKIPMGNVGPI